ncbi:MAG: hypothetical protein IK083_03625 [Abditibacteriota bacterium]|nr:hypothetical protein [Abditibacteriota bacterium]
MNKVLYNNEIDAKIWLHLSILLLRVGRLSTNLRQLADITGVSVRQLRYSLDKLEAYGLCHREYHGRGGIEIVTNFVTVDTPAEQAKEDETEPEIVTYFVTKNGALSPLIEADSCALAEKTEQNLSTKPEEVLSGSIAGDSRAFDEETDVNLSSFSSLNNLRDSNCVEKPNGRTPIPSSTPPISPPPSSLPDEPAQKPEKYFLSRREALSEVCEITANPAVRGAASEWIAMRYSKRGEHRLTAKAIRGAFQKLRNMGYNTESQAVACFEQSVEKLWDGLFEIKE